MSKRIVLHQTIHVGCQCHNKSSKKQSKKEEIKKKFIPRRPYNVRGRAQKKVNNVGRVIAGGADPLNWVNPLPEMRMIESKAERTLNIKPKANMRGGRMF